jgi:hypothetical protein
MSTQKTTSGQTIIAPSSQSPTAGTKVTLITNNGPVPAVMNSGQAVPIKR